MNSYRWIVRCHGRGPGFECAAFHLHFLCWYNRAREELFLLILKRHRQSSRSPYFNSSAPGDWSSKFSSSLLPAHLFSGWCSRCPYWFTFSERFVRNNVMATRSHVDLRQISAGRFVLPCLAPFWLQYERQKQAGS